MRAIRSAWLGLLLAFSIASVGAAEQIIRVATPKAAPDTLSAGIPVEEVQSPQEIQVERAPEEKTAFQFVDVPLLDVADFFRQKHHIEIQVDILGLEQAGISTDIPITRNLSGLSLRSALRLILRELELGYVIRDEVLLITTLDRVRSEQHGPHLRIYRVDDLIESGDYQSLIDVIESGVAPKTWIARGGPGSITKFAPAHCLVISQTADVHEEIGQVLRALRKARDLERGKRPIETKHE